MFINEKLPEAEITVSIWILGSDYSKAALTKTQLTKPNNYA